MTSAGVALDDVIAHQNPRKLLCDVALMILGMVMNGFRLNVEFEIKIIRVVDLGFFFFFSEKGLTIALSHPIIYITNFKI